ncbi:hypothetical protein LTR67_004441 [Exophiala xenobiotica]
MSSPPPQKRQKQSGLNTLPITANKEPSAPQTPLAPKPNTETLQVTSSPLNSRKRRASSPKLNTLPPGTTLPQTSESTSTTPSISIPAMLGEDSGKKRGRTNTPWTAQEEQRLKQMRDAGHGWSEIAKVLHA